MKRRHVVMAFCGLVLSLAAASASPAASKTGAVRLQLFKAGFIVLMQGGKGILSLDKRTYPLTIGGVSLGATIGASKADLIGKAYNLSQPSDIEGTYSATEAGGALAGRQRLPA